MSIQTCLRAFSDRFKSNYGSDYTLNYQIEYSLMKALLSQITANQLLKMADYLKFIDWAFLQSKTKGKILHIANLKYLANEYLTTIRPNPDFYYNDEGILIERRS
ncbi:MAG: hypothetical protein ACFFCI_24285 [Promethearchaeota archaeon]